jgi:glycosyltransferase involved in cell wall biosynthesis
VPPGEGILDLGVLPPTAVLDSLRRAAIAVLPSRHEAMPVFVIEALAAGRPVIVTKVGAMPDMVGEAGIVIRPEDAEILGDRLVALLQHPEIQGEMARRSAVLYSERHSWERQRQLLGSLYGGREAP